MPFLPEQIGDLWQRICEALIAVRPDLDPRVNEDVRAIVEDQLTTLFSETPNTPVGLTISEYMPTMAGRTRLAQAFVHPVINRVEYERKLITCGIHGEPLEDKDGDYYGNCPKCPLPPTIWERLLVED